MAFEDTLLARLRTQGGPAFNRTMFLAARSARGVAGATRSQAIEARALTGVTRGLTGATRALARGGLYAAAGGVGLLAYETKRSISAFEEKRKIVAQTNATLESTDRAAGVSARAIEQTADRLSDISGIDDEAIRELQNRLLTFPTITKPVFSRTAAASLDLAVNKGMEGVQAAELLGKALGDPGKGYTRLARAGVVFSDEQAKRIEQFDKEGEVAKAQAVILREIEKEYGGSAKAQRTSLMSLRTTLGNLEEAYGEMLAPAVDAGAEKLDEFANRALPHAEKMAQRTAAIFKRTDLTIGEKIRESGRQGRMEFDPLIDEVRTAFDRLDLGDKLGGAVEDAAPQMADAMAAQVPRMLSAFANAFVNAGPGGQLLTAALITAKLGGFSAAGRWAAGTMVGALKARFGREGPAAVASQLPLFTDSTQRTKFRGGGKLLGGALAAGMGAALVLEGPEIMADFAESIFGNNAFSDEARRQGFDLPTTMLFTPEAAGSGAEVLTPEERRARERRARRGRGGLGAEADRIAHGDSPAGRLTPRPGGVAPRRSSPSRGRTGPRSVPGPPEGWGFSGDIVLKVGERELSRVSAVALRKEARRG